MRKFKIHILLLALMVSVASVRCSSGANLLSSGSSLMSALGNVPNLSQFTSLLQTPGLDKLLGSALKKPFTLLAPTNDALSKLGSGALTNLTNPSNLSSLAGLLKNHIVPGKLDAAALAGTALTTAGGKALNLGGANLGSMIGGDKFNIFPVDKVLE